MTGIEIFYQPPPDFSPSLEVACAFLNINGKILILKRNGQERDCWGLPGGKLEKTETPRQAVRREFHEETGIHLSPNLKAIGTLYMRKPTIEYIFHMFQCTLQAIPDVTLNSEHSAFGWFTLEETQQLALMKGGAVTFDFYKQYLNQLS